MSDNLESYFKKNLSEDTPGDDSWNVPSDEVWEKVLPEIQKKKGIFIPWKYFYILGILLIGGLAYFLWPTNEEENDMEMINGSRVEQINEVQITNDVSDFQKENVKDIDHQNTTNLKDASDNKSEEIEANTENHNNSETAPNNTVETILKPSQENPKTNNSAESIIASQEIYSTDKYLSTYSKNEASHSTSSSSTYNNPSPQQIDKLSKKSIDQVALAPLDNSIEKIAPAPKINPGDIANKNEPFNNKGKLGIGAFFTPTFTATFLSGEYNNGMVESSNMYLYSSNWGLEFKYHISNKFAIITGVERSEVRSWSKSMVEFGYDNSTEHDMGDGKKENTSPVPMPTPFGEIDTEVTYQFQDSEDIPNGDLMQSVMETHLDVIYLSIPIGVEYNILRFSHFSWFAEAGLHFNHALRDATDFTSRIMHHGHDMDVVEEKMMGHPTYTENYLNFYIGTGLSYQFTNSFQLNLSGRYFGSITNVNLQDNLSTYVNGFNLKFGVVYLF